MKVRFAHLSDIHFGGENVAAVTGAAERIKAGGFDLTIVSGELTRFADIGESGSKLTGCLDETRCVLLERREKDSVTLF